MNVLISPYLIGIFICITLAIFLYLLINSFNVYFSDTTQTELMIINIIRNQDNPNFTDTQGITIEPSKKIKYSVISLLNSITIHEAKENLEKIVEKLSNLSISSHTYEIICILHEKSKLIHGFDQISPVIPNCRFLISKNNQIDDFKQCILSAKGQYILNSKFLSKDLINIENSQKQFIVMASPMNSVSLPIFNKSIYDIPIFAYKPAAMIIFSRLHSYGQKAVPEIYMLCQKSNLTVYKKNYYFSDFNPSFIYTIWYSAWYLVILSMYKSKFWTLGKTKRI